MKSCISTYSFERLYQDGDLHALMPSTRQRNMAARGVELVLNDETPDGSTPMEYAKALCAHAKEQGLEVPIYTTGANFFREGAGKGAGTALQAYRHCGRMQDPAAAT